MLYDQKIIGVGPLSWREQHVYYTSSRDMRIFITSAAICVAFRRCSGFFRATRSVLLLFIGDCDYIYFLRTF